MTFREARIRQKVEDALEDGGLWPEPRIGLNPAFSGGGSVEDLVAEGLLHPGCPDIFRVGKQEVSSLRALSREDVILDLTLLESHLLAG